MTDMKLFETWLREQDRSPLTVRGYLADLRAFACWFEQSNGKALGVEEITPADVREYRAYLQTVRRAGSATVRRHLMALRQFCRWALETGRIERDPTAQLKLPRDEKLAPGWLTKQQQYRLVREAERAMSAADTPKRKMLAVRDWALLVFLLNTGLRIAEVCTLTAEDVQMGERSGWVSVRGGKGSKSRKVPLNAEARKALRVWLDERERGDADSLFDLTPSGAYRRLAELGRRAGVEVHPHALRHTLAKNLVDAGVGLHEVAALLGHSNLNTTRIYTAPSARDLERALMKLEV